MLLPMLNPIKIIVRQIVFLTNEFGRLGALFCAAISMALFVLIFFTGKGLYYLLGAASGPIIAVIVLTLIAVNFLFGFVCVLLMAEFKLSLKTLYKRTDAQSFPLRRALENWAKETPSQAISRDARPRHKRRVK